MATVRKLTKRVVDNALPGAKDNYIWDQSLTGFGLKVTPAGRKLYVLKTRLNRAQRWFSIGRHGQPMKQDGNGNPVIATPENARKEAARISGLVADGIDPATEPASEERNMRVAQYTELYLAEGCATKRPSTVQYERGLIEGHIKPLLAKKRIVDLSKADIERFRDQVAEGKSASDTRTGRRGRSIIRGGPGAANRTLNVLSAILTFAVDRGMIAVNPARGVKKFSESHRHRFLTTKEVMNLGETLKRANENPNAVAAIKFLLFTGCRRNEALTLKWSYVDFDRRLLNFPETKTGQQSRPLSAPALLLLQSLPRTSEYVFPSSTKEGHLINIQKPWDRIRRKAKLGDVRINDLRHSFASFSVQAGESLYVVGKVLGHKKASTTQRYAHLDDDPVKVAADKTAAMLDALLSGKPTAQVAPLKR